MSFRKRVACCRVCHGHWTEGGDVGNQRLQAKQRVKYADQAALRWSCECTLPSLPLSSICIVSQHTGTHHWQLAQPTTDHHHTHTQNTTLIITTHKTLNYTSRINALYKHLKHTHIMDAAAFAQMAVDTGGVCVRVFV